MQLMLPYVNPINFLGELINKYRFSPTSTWASQSVMLPENIGSGFLQLFVKSDIHFFRGIWDFNEPTVFGSPDPVGKEGLIDFRISNIDQVLHSSALEGAKKFEWEITKVNGFRFFIPERYFNGDKHDLTYRFHNCVHHPLIKQMIKQLFEIPYRDFSNTMLLDAKLTEFVFYLICHLSNTEIVPIINDELPKRHLDCINEAHAIILANLDKEISISKLSRLVGLNQCDLKRDFKQVFGLPIKQYSIQQKIVLANKLITENHLDFSETARSLGYTNIKHFERLFNRYYGGL